MRKSLLSLLLLTSVTVSTIAQEYKVPNVLGIRQRQQSGTIREKGKLAGYYTFYFKEKQDKKNNVYEILLLDNELNKAGSFEIVRTKQSILMEVAYNGEAFMLFFYDPKIGYEFTTYDSKGKKLGSASVLKDQIPKAELRAVSLSLGQADKDITVYSGSKEGFVRQSLNKSKKVGFEINSYDNNAKVEWTYSSPATSPLFESVEISEVTDDFVTGTIYRRKSAGSAKMNLAFIILDRKTGEKIAELDMGNEDEGKQSVLRTFVDTKNQRVILVGEYYKPGDDILKDKSLGLFVKELDVEGAVLSHKEFDWKGKIAAFKQENIDEEDKKDDKPFSIFFHSVVRSENGHLFLVGEQFKKQVSATAVAGKMLAAAAGGSSNASSFEIRVGSMVIIELDEKNELADYDIVQKRKRSVLLPEGYGVYGSTRLGYYINSIGEFDYSFTAREPEADKFTVVYTDADRKEEKGAKNSKVMLGVIVVNKGEKSTERVGINPETRSYWIREAKPGYILVGEYWRKEKAITYRLEKVSFK